MILMQLIINGIAQSSIFILMAISVGLIYRVNGFFDFSLGMILTLSSYTYLLLYPLLPVWIAVIASIICGVMIGIISEASVYGPIRRSGGNSLILILASLGIGIIFQNIISLGFGDELRASWSNLITEGFPIYNARISMAQVLSIISSVLLIFFFLFMIRTKSIGCMLRAVTSDIELSHISGINVRAAQLFAVVIGSTFAAVAGILSGIDTGMKPTMGFNPFMMGTVALIIGGVRPVLGCVLGSLLLALLQQLSVFAFSGQWKDPVAFALLLIVLLARPNYLMGVKPSSNKNNAGIN